MSQPRSASSYGNYLKIEQLVSLQECISEPAHHDETLFIVTHQVYELWFKQLLHEGRTVRELITLGQIHPATRLVRRMIEIQRILIQQIAVLETMTPVDFAAFRDHLNPASGLQSVQFRELEFLSGLKDRAPLALHAKDEATGRRLELRFAEPSLLDALDACLTSRGLATEGGSEERLRALKALYSEPDANYDLYLLCESMIEYDENLLLWRQHHVLMVERMIGRKPGTGGTSGVQYLQTTLSKRCFPELWAVRSQLGGVGGFA